MTKIGKTETTLNLRWPIVNAAMFDFVEGMSVARDLWALPLTAGFTAALAQQHRHVEYVGGMKNFIEELIGQILRRPGVSVVDILNEISAAGPPSLSKDQLIALSSRVDHEDVRARVVQSIKNFLTDKQTAPVNETLTLSVIITLWAIFESFSKDLWVAVVNNHANPLAQSALSQLNGEVDGISRKSIEVGTLARYGFDLRGHLGSILEKRFDFTSFRGITNAFNALFVATKRKFKFESDLEFIELTRNLAAHRGGRVDQRYLDASGLPSLVLGRRLSLSSSQVDDAFSVVGQAAEELAQFVDVSLGHYEP